VAIAYRRAIHAEELAYWHYLHVEEASYAL
jgi:hypothetical protein